MVCYTERLLCLLQVDAAMYMFLLFDPRVWGVGFPELRVWYMYTSSLLQVRISHA